MSKQLDFVKEFLEFERQNNLFDLKDSQGTFVWDVVRFEIEYSLLWGFVPSVSGGNKSDIKGKIERILQSLRLLYSKKKYVTLAITTSRNRVDGKCIDQNQHDALLAIDRPLVIETIQGVKSYKGAYPMTVKNLYGKLHKTVVGKYNFQPVVELIEAKFGKIPQTKEYLNSLLEGFYAEKRFYCFLFKKQQIERVMLTQNGQMKGLMAAAKECGVKVFEFQHGIVNTKHFVYSYPSDVDASSKSYQPYMMLRFSDFWFSDFYAPFRLHSIGNNYFSKLVSSSATEPKSFLAISTNAFGKMLSDFVLNCNNDEWKIYYKLHPNEFGNLEYYRTKFASKSNIEIVTNELSVNDLLDRCSTMITMQSTAIYEAIQAGRCVIVVDSGEYNEITGEGIFHITNPVEINEILDHKRNNIAPTIYFDSFSEQKFKNAIKE